MLYDRVATLPLAIEDVTVEQREQFTASDFTRTTTIVSLYGDGTVGRGEDVTYDAADHERLAAEEGVLDLPNPDTFDAFATALDDIDLFLGAEPGRPAFRHYRRWAFESAALDLALKQAGTNLAGRLERAYSPVRFVISTRLGDPPTGDRVLGWLERDPALEFKLDPTPDWLPETIERLAETNAVRTLDLKGHYQGTEVERTAEPDLYKRVVDAFPRGILEDPELAVRTREILAGHEDRVSWDAPIESVASIRELPWEPSWLNIKPSRFGSVESLFAAIAYCLEEGIRMYGGGQFELGVGREHLHTIASLFYPDGPNDIAPGPYNLPDPPDDLPGSPLVPNADPPGLCWS